MLLLVGPSGTDTFIVTVVIITAVVKQICKPTLDNLSTVIFSFLTLKISWCVSVCWVCERFSGPRRPECLQVASMETCCENTAAAQPGMRYLVCGEACYLTRAPPHHHAPLSATLCTKLESDGNRNMVKRLLWWLKRDTDNNQIWKQPTVYTC